MAVVDLTGITFDESDEEQMDLSGISFDDPEPTPPPSTDTGVTKEPKSIVETLPSIGRWLMGPARGPVTKPGEDKAFEQAREDVAQLGAPDADTLERQRQAAEGLVTAGLSERSGGSEPLAETIYPNLPLPLRAAIEAAAKTGAVIENPVLRFFGYGESADRNRRAVEALAKYNRALDESSIFGKAVGPLMGGLTTSLAQGTLAGPGGRTAIASSFGIDGADRGYVEYKEKFPGDEKGALLHGAAQGTVDGLLTYIGGGLAQKFGAQIGDTFAPVIGREVMRAAQNTGLRTLLKTSLFEAGEEGVQQALTSLEAVRSGVNPDAMETIMADVITSTLVGAVGGAAGPAVGATQIGLAEKYKQFRSEIPDRLDGVKAANMQAATGEAASVEGKSEAWKNSFDEELNALASLEAELNSRGVDVRAEEKKLQAERTEVQGMESELSGLRKELSSIERLGPEENQRRVQLSRTLEDMDAGLQVAKQNLAEKDAALQTRKQKLEKELAPQRKFLEDELFVLEAKEAKATGRTVEPTVQETDTGSTLPPVTSAKQEALDRDRKAFGMDEIPERQRVSFQQNLDTAREKGVDKNAYSISANLLKDMRPIDAVTEAGLTDRLRQIKDAHDTTRTARDSEGLTQSQRDELNAQTRDLEAEYDVISEALHRTGSDIGTALVNRKLQLANDFSEPNVLSRAKRAKGQGAMKELTDTERSKLSDKVRALESVEASLAQVPPGNEYDDLDFRRHKLKAEINTMIGDMQWKAKPMIEKATFGAYAGTQDFVRAFTLGFDLAPALRQGITVVRTRPLVALDATKKFFSALTDAKKAYIIERNIKFDPDFDVARKHKLAFLEDDSPLSAREDQLQSIMAERLPLMRNFQRAYRVFMNSIRMSTFKASMRSYGGRDRLTDSNLAELANFVNISTGRGGLGAFEGSAHGLAQGFLAPRFYMSRIQYLSGQPMWRALWRGDKTAARIMATEYSRALIGAAIMNYTALTFGKLAFGDKAVSFKPVSTNPFDPDAGYLVIGDARVDMTGGMGRYVKFAGKLGENVHASLTGDKRNENSEQSFVGMLKGSLAPHARGIVNLATGKTGSGEKATLENIVYENYLPLTPKDAIGAFQKEGVGRGAAISLLTLFGGSSFSRDNDR